MRQKLANPKFSPGEPQRESGEIGRRRPGVADARRAGDRDPDGGHHGQPRGLAGAQDAGQRRALADNGKWTNLGPDNAVYPLNPSRNRFVYVPNEYVAAGRTAHSVIDPNCRPGELPLLDRERGRRRLADGRAVRRGAEVGVPVRRTSSTTTPPRSSSIPNDATQRHDLRRHRRAEHLPQRLHRRRRPLQVEGRRQPLVRPDRRAVLRGPRHRLDPGEAGRPVHDLRRAQGAQGSRGISNTCCTGVDRGANIPGAPHFGLWRSTDGGQTFELVSQGNTTNCTTATPTEVFNGLTPCSPRGARRVHFDPVDPNTVYATFGAKGIWRSNSNGDPGTWVQIFAPRGRPPARRRARTSSGPSSTSWSSRRCDAHVRRRRRRRAVRPPRFFRSDSVRTGAPTFTELTNNTSAGLLRSAVQLRQLRLRAAEGRRDGTQRRHRLPARRQRLHPGCAGNVERPRGPAVDRRRRVVHRHDLRRDGRPPAARHPPRPALDRHASRRLEAVPRDGRRRHRPLERELLRRLGPVREVQPAADSDPSGDVSGGDQQDPGAHRVHQQGTQHAPLLPDDLQPESPRRARRQARRTTARG